LILIGSGFSLSELRYGSFANYFPIYVVPLWKLMVEDACKVDKYRVSAIMCSLWLP